MQVPAIVLGNRHGPFPTVVSAGFIRSYADATADPNPAYAEGSAVPPAALVSQVFDIQTAGNSDVPQEVWDTMKGAVHGEHDLLLHRPLEPGESLSTWVEGHGGRVSGHNTRVTIRMESLDETGTIVAEQYWTTVLFGTNVAESVGSDPPDHGFPKGARSRPGSSARIHVDKDMPRRYAELSGDWSAHHFDPEAAAKASAPEPFLHGLCTMGLCARAAVETVAGGDPRRVRRVAVRFGAPTFLERDLDVQFYGASSDSYAFEASVEGTVVIKNGIVELFA
jgi:acyl dehydratase